MPTNLYRRNDLENYHFATVMVIQTSLINGYEKLVRWKFDK